MICRDLGTDLSAAADPQGRRLLPRDKRLCCELLVNVYLDSCKLDATKESLISPLYLWESLPPRTSPDERLECLSAPRILRPPLMHLGPPAGIGI